MAGMCHPTTRLQKMRTCHYYRAGMCLLRKHLPCPSTSRRRRQCTKRRRVHQQVQSMSQLGSFGNCSRTKRQCCSSICQPRTPRTYLLKKHLPWSSTFQRHILHTCLSRQRRSYMISSEERRVGKEG